MIDGIRGLGFEDLVCSLQFLVQVVRFYSSLGGIARAFNGAMTQEVTTGMQQLQ